MAKRNRFSVVPKTPRGQHIRFAEVSADEIDFDDEVSVKSTVFRGRRKTPVGAPSIKTPRRSSK